MISNKNRRFINNSLKKIILNNFYLENKTNLKYQETLTNGITLV